MSAVALWAAVEAAYESEGLVSLTNINDPAGTTIDSAVGESAAQAVIDLWPAYAQIDYDANDALHVQVALRGTIAMLWERGGSAAEIARIEWDEVFGDNGLISKVRRTSPRAHRGPSSNSEVQQASRLTTGGGKVRGWSDVESLPVNWMPQRRTVDSE